jgi:hypothetical protein
MIYEKDITRSLKAILCEAVSINKHMGSSTAVLLGLDPQTAIMRTTNLGDSGYMIFRAKEDGEKIDVEQLFKSKEQQYRFNFPY